MPSTRLADKKLRLIFMGTPEFACPGLQALLDEPSFELAAVFTQADKPVGRRQALTPPPIKRLAEQHQIPVFQPAKIKTATQAIRDLQPDLIIVIAYGKIIPPEILTIPEYGCLNVHASLLPKYRGASCLNAPILNGDAETGVTIMQIDAGLDTGPILRQAKIKLSGRETLSDLHDRLAELGAKELIPTIKDFVQGKIKPQAQDESRASYVKILNKTDGRIDWSKPAIEIERQVRAYDPWPGSYTVSPDGKSLKILSVEREPIGSANHQIGEMFLSDGKLLVQCGQAALSILRLQMAGGKPLSAEEFKRGHSALIGQILH
ncbi:MAG: methionyl-tRNA formyltransferase [Patescibacteria group bacterium]